MQNFMRRPSTQDTDKQTKRRSAFTRWRWATLLGVMALVAMLAGCGAAGASGGTSLNTGPGGPANSTFQVTSVGLVVSPSSIGGKACGTSATFTYTATFHIPPNSAGGVINFAYTLNNGRSQTPASVTAGAGKTSVTYTFTSTGVLSPDNTFPGNAIVMVNSPNQVQSPSVRPTGTCVGSASFQVNSVSMAVSPTSIAGLSCGSSLTVTYTATFQIAPNGPGGTIQFMYTVDNGRGSNPASVSVAPGQTTVKYSFTWSGTLPSDHTAPEGGGVIVQSPNSVNSPLLGPSGKCS